MSQQQNVTGKKCSKQQNVPNKNIANYKTSKAKKRPTH
jgi:hypothetical protein